MALNLMENLERAQVDAMTGAVMLEFGTEWCGYCRAAQTLILSALQNFPDVRRIKIEDGKGRPLGRSFKVKLWPTLIFLRDGQEVARIIRPQNGVALEQCLTQIATKV